MGTSPITPCYDVERLETKTHVGLGPGESIEYTKHRVSLEGHPWNGCHPVSDTWHPYSYGQTKQKRSLNNVGQVNPEDCYLSRKDCGLQGRDIQVVKPYKCGWRGPASHLTNVWMDTLLDHAQEEAMPLVEWAPMGHCNPKEEYANVSIH